LGSGHAVVVSNNGARVREEDIIRFCRKRMARFKAPKSFAFLSALPKSPQGKILKRESRKIFSKGAGNV
jgi:fatty-acyl-CoA synthase